MAIPALVRASTLEEVVKYLQTLIGNIQPLATLLTTLGGLTPTARKVIRGTGTTFAMDQIGPQNLLPNSQFSVSSNSVPRTVFNASAVSVASHSTATNTVVALTSNTRGLKKGQQIWFVGDADASLRTCLHTLIGVVENVSITFNLEGSANAAGGGACTCYLSGPGYHSTAGYETQACDGWKKNTTLINVRNYSAEVGAAGATKPPSYYCMQVQKKAATAERWWFEGYNTTNYTQVYELAGQDMAHGFWAYPRVSNAVRLFFRDGPQTLYSAYFPVNVWSWVEFPYTVSPLSTLTLFEAGIEFNGSIDDIHDFACARMDYGSYLGGYVKPQNEIIIPTALISPVTWVPANVGGSDSIVVRICDETNGQIPRTARAVIASLEGVAATAGGELWLWENNGLNDQQTLGIILAANTAGAKLAERSHINICWDDPEGWLWIGSNATSEWTLVAIDVSAVIM